jgi:hypothetical protein
MNLGLLNVVEEFPEAIEYKIKQDEVTKTIFNRTGSHLATVSRSLSPTFSHFLSFLSLSLSLSLTLFLSLLSFSLSSLSLPLPLFID